jgi:lysophospholipase L1-like esterase
METQVIKTFSCLVTDVFSGDDLIALVDLGVNDVWLRRRLRLHGVDTPNAANETDETPAGKIRVMVRKIARYRRGHIQVMSMGPSSWVVKLVVEAPPPHGTVDLNSMLIGMGHVFQKGKVESKDAK